MECMKLMLAPLSDSAARSLARSGVMEAAKARLLGAARKSKAVMMSLAFALSLSSSAFAGNEDTDLEKLVASTDTISSMMTKVWTICMANPLLTVYVAGGLLSMGIGFFLYLKKAARH